MNKILFDYLTHQASVIFIVSDKKGKIVQSNQYSKNLLGEDLNEKNLKDIFLDFSDSDNLIEKLQAKQQTDFILNINTQDNNLPETFSFRIYFEDEQLYIFGELDKEELGHLKTELLDTNNELSNLTRELHKKNAELKKLNDLKDHFMSVAAHDLRNPVSNIIRLSEFLLDELKDHLSSQQYQFLILINSLGEFGLNLLNDLLDLAKIQAGKLKLNKKPTSLVDVIKSCIDLNQFSANRKEISLQLKVLEKIEPVNIDQNAIKQVMDNLLSNAIKFSPRQSSITVGMFTSNDNITVFVKDSGPGIDESEQDKLFKPFSKTSVQATENEKGTGLGLSIVQKIVMSHQGKIWVQSKKNEGTTFYFSLPYN